MKSEIKMSVPACRISMPEASRDAILSDIEEILVTGQVILGKWTKEFERLWSDYVGHDHGVAVSCDTGAMEILFRVWKDKYGWKDGDYVMLPATAFFSCATAIKNAKLVPVVCDASAEAGVFPTLNQFVSKAETLPIGEDVEVPRLVCFLAVYAAGYVGSAITEIVEWCDERDIKVIEDAAHCHGSTLWGNQAGSLGHASCWSFYATKVLNTHEGGMILVDDPDDAEACRIYRNYGRVSAFGRSLAKYEGYNWRLTEINCRLGVDQVTRVDELMHVRRERAAWYDDELEKYPILGMKGFSKLEPPQGCVPNYYRYLVMLPSGLSNEAAIELRQKLKDLCATRGVHLAGEVYEATLNCQPIFEDLGSPGDFPQAEWYCAHHVCLPINNDGTQEEVAYVVEVFAEAVEELVAVGL